MIDVGPVYLAVAGALLLVALGLGLRVLREIAREGLDRRRRRRAGEIEKYTEDESYGPPADPGEAPGDAGGRDGSDGPSDRTDPAATCPQCGAVNAPEFSYCRRCAAPLRSGV